MPQKRRDYRNVMCPLCGQMHLVQGNVRLYQAVAIWNGYLTLVWCTVREQHIYKLYDENYKYVCWQQNTAANVPDHDGIPF